MSMSGYTKLFSSIVTSTVWREPDHVRLVWITMLALSDRFGVVEASVPGLADMARVSMKDCQDALVVLASPDQFSRTKEFEGRRICETDGGWQLINHAKYRNKLSADERRVYNAAKQQESRDRKKAASLTVIDESAESAHTEATPAPSPTSTPQATTDAQNAPSALVRVGENPHAKPTNLVNGSELRRHGQHAWCDHERGLCVTAQLHREFQQRGMKSDADLRAWYPSVIAALGSMPVGDDLFDFWRAAFSHWVGTVAVKASARKLTRNEQSMAAAGRVLARIEGRKS